MLKHKRPELRQDSPLAKKWWPFWVFVDLGLRAQSQSPWALAGREDWGAPPTVIYIEDLGIFLASTTLFSGDGGMDE